MAPRQQRRHIIGNAVRDKRESLGLEQQALASRAGISAPYLSRIENGTRRPLTATIASIASALGVTVEAITGIDDEAAA